MRICGFLYVYNIDYDTCLEYDEKTSVVKGTFQHTTESISWKEVVIKMLKSSFRTEQNIRELGREAKLLFYVGNHQHILQLLGITSINLNVGLGIPTDYTTTLLNIIALL